MRLSVPIAILLIIISCAYSIDHIYVKVGEVQNRKLYVYNPAKTMEDHYVLKITSTGNINAWIKNIGTQTYEFTAKPLENKSIPIIVVGTYCTSSSCSGEINFKVTSLKTGNSATKKIEATVSGIPTTSGKLRRAPGIEFWNFILIGLVASLILYLKNY